MSFFKSWRRRFGASLLLVSCLFAAGWVRGLSYLDFVALSGQFLTWNLLFVASSNEGVEFLALDHRGDDATTFAIRSTMSYSIAHIKNSRTPRHARYDDCLPHWQWESCGGGVVMASDATSNFIHLTVPYWSIVLPSTTLSAWLLLSKPQARKTSLIARSERQ